MLVHEKCIQLYLKHKIIKCMHLFLFGEHMEESGKWIANYETSDEHMVLKEELIVALTLGGARTAGTERYPAVLRKVVGAAGSCRTSWSGAGRRRARLVM